MYQHIYASQTSQVGRDGSHTEQNLRSIIMHLKRRPRPLLHAPRSIPRIRPRWQRIRPERLINQRNRHLIRDHATENLPNISHIITCAIVFATPKTPRMI
jgi:hypothetical protein